MKKRMIIQSLILAVLAVTILTGCGGKKKADVNVDVKALAAELNQAITSDTLTQAAEAMIKNVYYLDDDSCAAADAYWSDGTTACEVAVIDCGDASKTEGVTDKFKSRVSSQKDLYATYNADEAARLDKAIIRSAGKYAVLAVVDDTAKAEEILKKAGF